MLLCLLLLQSASLPDIEIHARVTARTLTIEKQGEVSLVVSSDPPGNNLIDVRAPKANGRKRIDNPEIEVNTEIRIANPSGPPS